MLADLHEYVARHERPHRRALSSMFPVLVGPAVFVKKTRRALQNRATLKKLEKGDMLPFVLTRHSSLLYRKLGESDPRLQHNKVTNLKLAIEKLDGLIIPPGAVFSFWHVVGDVSKKKGYVPGMLLSNGQVAEGIGGGLCQLSNFLFWSFLHADIQILERHHHSVDAFPDSGRTLPFGSGATIFSNYLDLKIKNISKHPIQLKLWITDTALKGQILSDVPGGKKFHVFEKNHYFLRKGGRYFRYNEIYRQTLVKGVVTKEERIVVNFAPIVYPVSDLYIKERGYAFISLD